MAPKVYDRFHDAEGLAAVARTLRAARTEGNCTRTQPAGCPTAQEEGATRKKTKKKKKCKTGEKGMQWNSNSTNREDTTDDCGKAGRGEKRKNLLKDLGKRKKTKVDFVREGPEDSSLACRSATTAKSMASASAGVDGVKKPLKKKRKSQGSQQLVYNTVRSDKSQATKQMLDVENGSFERELAVETDSSDDISNQELHKDYAFSHQKLERTSAQTNVDSQDVYKKAAQKDSLTSESGEKRKGRRKHNSDRDNNVRRDDCTPPPDGHPADDRSFRDMYLAMFSDSFGRQLSNLYADDGEEGPSNRCGADVVRFYIKGWADTLPDAFRRLTVESVKGQAKPLSCAPSREACLPFERTFGWL